MMNSGCSFKYHRYNHRGSRKRSWAIMAKGISGGNSFVTLGGHKIKTMGTGMGTTTQGPSEAEVARREERKVQQLMAGFSMLIIPIIGGIGWAIVHFFNLKALLIAVSFILYISMAAYLIHKGNK